MSLGTERTPVAEGHLARLKEALGLGSRDAGSWGQALRPVGAWFRRQPLVRFVSGSLLRRILLSNLIGLAVLLGGIWYLSEHRAWLIEAKRESLKAQADIIAAAIAANAKIERGQFHLDPDKLPETDDSLIPFRDDGFRALELSISPERVTPVLRRLMQSTDIRARVYGRDGTLIVDSQNLLSRGQVVRTEPTYDTPKTKNFWTRLQYWWIDKELPVYKEIGTAKGTAYPEVRAALTGASTPMMMLTAKGEQIVSMAVPIQRAKAVQGALLLSTRPGDIDEDLGKELAIITQLAALALATTLLTSFLLARTVAGPMRRLSAAANHVSRDINTRHELPDLAERTDEVGQMGRAFRSMTSALYKRIEASEKFAADVAHELKNPLTAARSTAESLGYAKSDEQRDELVAQIQNELKRLNRLITDVSNASRLNAELARQQMEPIDVTTVISNVTQIFRDIHSAGSCRIALSIEPSPVAGGYVVKGDEGRLAQVLTNLVDNAISFSPEGGTVTIRSRIEGGTVEIFVEDDGPGIPEDRLKKIFERFYTDRPLTEAIRGKNSGLGLSISREIIEAHGGQIWAENRVDVASAGSPAVRGARFVVQLPRLTGAGQRGGMLGGRRG